MLQPASIRSLAGQAALVTGGARRIGREIALRLARAGADVAITYRNSSREAAQTLGEMEAQGVRGLAISCDMRAEDSVRAAMAEVIAGLGRLDLLVNNAAVFPTAPFEKITLEQWDEAFETNARGPFLIAREALPHLRAAQGRIINISSLGASRAWAGHAPYCSSKAALEMLTRAMAKGFAPEVTVNCVAPGYVEFDPAAEEALRFAARTPMGRNGSAAEIAEAVLFFAAGPRFITGQILGVDGGLGL